MDKELYIKICPHCGWRMKSRQIMTIAWLKVFWECPYCGHIEQVFPKRQEKYKN